MKIITDILYHPFIKYYLSKIVYSGVLEKIPGYKQFYLNHINSVIKSLNKRPRTVHIELTNACNADCVTCFRGNLKVKIGKMDVDLAKNIIDQISEWGVGNIITCPFGEFFLYKDYFEILQYARMKDLKVLAFTNGQLLTKEISENIIDLLDILAVSIDGYDKKSFESARRNLDFDQVFENVCTLKNLRNERGSDKPFITLFSTLNSKNYWKINKIKHFWGDHVDQVLTHFQHSWATENEKLINNSAFKIKNVMKRYPCDALWTSMIVTWDGKVAGCCADYNVVLEMGNVNKQTLKEIWHGEKFKNLRKAHLNGYRGQVVPCDKCTMMPKWWLNKL